MRKNKSREYKRIWRAVDGALIDTINKHPNFFNKEQLKRHSMTKRIVGTILSLAEMPIVKQ